MTAPYLNTQSFKFAVVLEGEGEVQIVCPHLGQDSEREHEHEGGDDDRHERPRHPRGQRNVKSMCRLKCAQLS